MPRDGFGDAGGDGLLHEWLCRRNISNFKAQLVSEGSEPRRLMLERLLFEEEARLRGLLSSGELMEAGSDAGYRAVISGLLGELRMETDPSAARRLRDRLIEEEDRFAASSERLDIADGLIDEVKRNIESQELLISGLSQQGANTLPHQRLLENFKNLLANFEARRSKMAENLWSAKLHRDVSP